MSGPSTITVPGFTRIITATPPLDAVGTYDATTVGAIAPTIKPNNYRPQTDITITTLQSGDAVARGATFLFGGKTWLVYRNKKSKESHNSSEPPTIQTTATITRPAP